MLVPKVAVKYCKMVGPTDEKEETRYLAVGGKRRMAGLIDRYIKFNGSCSANDRC